MANNNSIEKSATTTVDAILNDTGYIEPYISSGDKEPIWDGYIYVYNDKEKHNNDKNYQFRIPVQVKGTLAKIENSLKYSIKVSHLKSYLKDGGVLYFVVQVDENDNKNNKIFYVDLLPYKIKKILKTKEHKKKISVDIKKFPFEKQDIVEKIYNFNLNYRKQDELIPDEYIPITDFEKISFHYNTPFNNKTPKDILLNFEGYCYGYKNNIPYPILEIQKGDISGIATIDQKVYVQGQEYFSNFRIKHNINNSTFIFNDNLEFVFDRENNEAKYRLLFQGTLTNYIKSCQFLLDTSENKGFSVNDANFEVNIKKSSIADIKRRIKRYKTLQQALTLCGVSKELYLKEFTEKDTNTANALIETFINKNGIKLKVKEKAYILSLRLCNSTITCLANRLDNGKYIFNTFSFDGDTKIGNDDKKIQVSPCMVLRNEHFQNSLNIQFSQFLDDIKKYDIEEGYLFFVNKLILELLLAYDITTEQILLKTAEDICEWLEAVNTNIEFKELYHLNTLQCKIRKNKELSEEDKEYLYNITDNNQNNLLKFGASVLLRDKNRGERYFKKLSDEEQTEIQNCPIYNLWKDLNNG